MAHLFPRDFFFGILELLRGIRRGGLHYIVDWRVLDTKKLGVPQSRHRLWIVAMRNDAMEQPLQWPRPRGPCSSVDDLLAGARPSRAVLLQAVLRCRGLAPFAKANVLTELARLCSDGKNPFQETYIIEADASPSRGASVMRGCSPCLTRRRCQAGGHWISTRGRRLNTVEMLWLQHMDPERFQIPSNVSLNSFHALIGNSMSVNVVEAILAMLSRSCPGVFGGRPPLADPWSAP